MSLDNYLFTFIKQKYHNGKSQKNLTSLIISFMRKQNHIKNLNDLSKNAKGLLSTILNSKQAPETQRKIIYILSMIFERLGNTKAQQRYRAAYLNLKKQITEQRKTNKPISAKEADCVDVSWEELKSKPINMDELDQKTLLYNLLIYIDETPRLDFRTLIYQPDSGKNTKNYINLNNAKIVLNDYKTKSTYGQWVIPIRNAELIQYLRKYVKAHNIKPNNYLFLNKNNKPYPSHKFSEFTQRMFDKKLGYKITMNCLRKIKEKYLFHNNPKTLKMSYKEKEDLVAHYFKHNLQTSMLYYNIVD